MPRYEIAAHVILDLACDTPDEAAAIVRHRLLDESSGASALRHLAVWPISLEPTTWQAPATLRRQLAEFFAEVERYAAGAEVAFRAQVGALLASNARDATPPPADVVLGPPRMRDCPSGSVPSGPDGLAWPER